MKNKKNNKKVKFYQIESGLYKFFALIIIILIVCLVCSETALAQINVDVQKAEKEVLLQEKRLESLAMKIDELTSLDRIKEVCLEYGLSYISENIKTIE